MTTKSVAQLPNLVKPTVGLVIIAAVGVVLQLVLENLLRLGGSPAFLVSSAFVLVIGYVWLASIKNFWFVAAQVVLTLLVKIMGYSLWARFGLLEFGLLVIFLGAIAFLFWRQQQTA